MRRRLGASCSTQRFIKKPKKLRATRVADEGVVAQAVVLPAVVLDLRSVSCMRVKRQRDIDSVTTNRWLREVLNPVDQFFLPVLSEEVENDVEAFDEVGI